MAAKLKSMSFSENVGLCCLRLSQYQGFFKLYWTFHWLRNCENILFMGRCERPQKHLVECLDLQYIET